MACAAVELEPHPASSSARCAPCSRWQRHQPGLDGTHVLEAAERDPRPTARARTSRPSGLIDGSVDDLASGCESSERTQTLLMDLAAPFRIRLLRPSPDGGRLVTIVGDQGASDESSMTTNAA